MKLSTTLLIGVTWIFIAGAIYTQLPVGRDSLPTSATSTIPQYIQTSQSREVSRVETPPPPTPTPSPAPKPNPPSTPAPTPPVLAPPTTPTTTPAPASSTPPTTAPTSTPTSTPASATSEASYAQAVEIHIHTLINIERQKVGLELLSWSDHLSIVARAHSRDMLLRDYFAHNDQDGCDSSCRVTNSGYRWRTVGENIYMMSGYNVTPARAAEMVVDGWMNSPGHRANILSDAFSEEGIGVVVEERKLYATENFARPR